MKMIKKITGLAAAAAMLFSIAALPADAAYIYSSYTEVENGAVAVHRDRDICGYIAITDGTELETFAHWGWGGQPFESILEIQIEDEAIPDWNEDAHVFQLIDASSIVDWSEDSGVYQILDTSSIVKWSETSSALFASYGTDVRFYNIRLNEHQEYRDRLSEIARNYMLENEGVLDVIGYSYHVDGLAEWNGEIDCAYDGDTPNEILAADNQLIYPHMLEAYQNYTAWQQMLSDWQETTDTTGMSASEIAASRAAAGIPSNYQMVDYAYGMAKEIREINPEYMIWCEPDLRLRSGTMIFTTAPIWDGIGDVDGNGEIDASDASAILAEAALTGSGKNGTFTDEQKVAADVNADGQVDSADAAYILMYCSLAGTGADVSMADVVKR